MKWNNRFFDFATSRESLSSGGRVLVDQKCVRDFLAQLAVKRQISASTQNQAFNALLFFFRQVLNEELGDLKHAVRAQNRKKLPVVFSVNEIKSLLNQFDGTTSLLMKLIYGGGLRGAECVRLRLKDLDCHR